MLNAGTSINWTNHEPVFWSRSAWRDPFDSTHRCQVTHKYVIDLAISGLDNGLSIARRQTNSLISVDYFQMDYWEHIPIKFQLNHNNSE